MTDSNELYEYMVGLLVLLSCVVSIYIVGLVCHFTWSAVNVYHRFQAVWKILQNIEQDVFKSVDMKKNSTAAD